MADNDQNQTKIIRIVVDATQAKSGADAARAAPKGLEEGVYGTFSNLS
jgi:hypothetical protein